MDKPDVDFIEGLSPAVSIDQKSTNRNPRSTVGTITEVYDYLRLLYARAGRPHCPVCGEPIARQTPAADRRPGARAATRAPGSRCSRRWSAAARASTSSCSPSCRPRASPGPGSTARSTRSTEPPEAGEAGEAHHRGGRRPARGQGRRPSGGSPTRSRPRSAWPAASSSSSSSTSTTRTRDRERRFSEKLACPNDHPLAIDELEPRSFSFNSPVRRLPGVHRPRHRAWRSTPSWSSPTPTLTPRPRARSRRGARRHVADYFQPADRRARPTSSGFDLDTPWDELPAKARRGAARRAPTTRSTSATRTATAASASYYAELRGRRPVRRAPARARPSPTRAGSATRATCARCRARPARAPGSSRSRWPCSIGGAVHRRGLPRCRSASCATFLRRRSTSPTRERQIAERVLKEINARLGFLLDVGLDYLSPRPRRRHAVRRRGAAHPAGHPDRLRPGRRALRARRAVDRAAPARQPPADRDPRSGCATSATR